MFRTSVRCLTEILLILSLLLAPVATAYAQASDSLAASVETTDYQAPAAAHPDDECTQKHQNRHHHSNSDCCGLVVMGLPASQPDSYVAPPTARFHTYSPQWQTVELDNLLRPPRT